MKNKKRIIFPLGEREVIATQERLLLLPKGLIEAGFQVEIITYKEEIYEKAKKLYPENKEIKTTLVETGNFIASPQFRDNLVKIFIRQTSELKIPETDLRLWKTCAFDDFRGHISQYTYPDLNLDQDILLFPLPSFDEPPPPKSDVFYSSLLFLAKEQKIPIIALQVYPVFHTPLLFLKIMDYFILKEEFEKEYYRKLNIAEDKLFILSNSKESYLLDTIEDIYKNLLLDDAINVSKEELGILVINHPRFRPQIKEILKVISSIKAAKKVFLLKRGYHIRDLSEEQVIEDLIKDDLKRVGGKYYLADEGALVKLLMISEVIIATSYIIPLQFAIKYRKTAVVYNPLYTTDSAHKGVLFLNEKESLAQTINSAYSLKKKTNSLAGILKRIAP